MSLAVADSVTGSPPVLKLKGATRLALLAVAFGVIPALGNDYWFSAILIPFLVLSLAGLGLNILTGYAEQLSLGSSAFMAVGAFASYNFLLRVPHLPLLASFALGGARRGAVLAVADRPQGAAGADHRRFLVHRRHHRRRPADRRL